MELHPNRIYQGDCVQRMEQLGEGKIDLAFADPPFNIGYDYDVYEDRVEHREYIEWSSAWIGCVYRVLKPQGAFWLAIGDEYAAELKLASQKIGFHCRSWVVWYYTFGVNCARKFTRSHAHLFHFVKDPVNFTFRDEDLDNRVPSARELFTNDSGEPPRRCPTTPDIRPADAVVKSSATTRRGRRPLTLRGQGSDVHAPAAGPPIASACRRIPGISRGWHLQERSIPRSQMPEQLRGIIRTCSHPRPCLDPFSAATTWPWPRSRPPLPRVRIVAEAVKCGRAACFDPRWRSSRRFPEPLSALTTGSKVAGAGRRNSPPSSPRTSRPGTAIRRNPTNCARGVVEAFQKTHEGLSADRVVADPVLNQQLCRPASVRACGRSADVEHTLPAEKGGQARRYRHRPLTTVAWEDCDDYLFASETRFSRCRRTVGPSLDEILCDPPWRGSSTRGGGPGPGLCRLTIAGRCG